MASSEKPRPVDAKMLSESLSNQAQRLQHLAERLSDHGEPLSRMEKRECRIGMTGWLDDLHSEAESFFIGGHYEMYRHNVEFTIDVLKYLS